MSLINEALKKAQHQRSGPPADLPPMPGSSDGSHAARRGRGLPARAVVWIAAGGGAVVVIAVLVTIALVRREPAPPPAAAPVPPAAVPSSP
ncbi:MAG: hypothetical protein JSR48_06055, partial [Verrucomicrobia bacterium]|nr:hypothetical protein [Verrucomicrobiota bacterium]